MSKRVDKNDGYLELAYAIVEQAVCDFQELVTSGIINSQCECVEVDHKRNIIDGCRVIEKAEKRLSHKCRGYTKPHEVKELISFLFSTDKDVWNARHILLLAGDKVHPDQMQSALKMYANSIA